MKKYLGSCLLILVLPLIASSQVCFSWQKQYGPANKISGDQFNCVARRPSGSLVFLNNNRFLVEISPAQEIVQEKALQIPYGLTPRKVAFAADGDAFVVADNFSANCAGDIDSEVRLYRLHANTLDTVWERTLDMSWFFILGVKGKLIIDEIAEQIFVTTNIAIYKIDFDGNLLKKKTTVELDSTFEYIYHFERLDNGSLQLLRGSSLWVLDADLNLISSKALQYILPGNAYFSDICFNSQNGNILLSVHHSSSSGNFWDIVNFNAEGEILWKKPLDTYSAFSPLVGLKDDEIWVFNQQEIEVWDQTGTLTRNIDLEINPSIMNEALYLPGDKYILAGATGGASLALLTDCQESTNIIEATATSIVSIRPNPPGDFVEIILDAPGEHHLQLSDEQGKQLEERNFTAHIQLDTSKLPSGLYFITLRSDFGRVITRKLLIQH